MSPRSPSAYLLSAFLHTFVVVTLLMLAYCAQRAPDEPPHVFELVAGEGDNFAATEAPAVGVPEAPKVELPAIKAPPPKAPPPEPVVELPQPKPTPLVQPQPAPPKIEPKATPPPQPKKAPDPPKQVAKAPTMTKAEFDKLNPQKTTPARKAAAPPPIRTKKIDAEGIAKGVTAGSPTVKAGAGGKALTRAETDLLDAYAALIRQRVLESLQNAGLSDLLETRVEFRVSAAGAISGVRVVASSGSAEFDRVVVGAFQSLRPIGPTPTNQAHVFALTVRVSER